jgi:hypothetical protein
MSGVGGGCGNYYETVDYSNISIPQGSLQGLQGSHGFSSYGNFFHQQQHNHHTQQGHLPSANSIFMEETSNSSSNNEQTENEASPGCFLLESSSLQDPLDNPDPGTPLPSFQETYSPRYRRDVFSFDESSVSPSFSGAIGGGGPSNSAPATPHSSHQQQHPRRFALTHQHSLDSPSSSTTASPQTPISYHQMYYPSQSPSSYEIMHSPPPPIHIPSCSATHQTPKQRKT